MDLGWSQTHKEWIWEREGFSYAPKFPSSSSVSKHVPTDTPYFPVSLFSLSSEKGIQLFQMDKYICIVLSHTVYVLPLYKGMCNSAHCNKPALKLFFMSENKGWCCSATFLSALTAIQTIKSLPLLKMNNCRGLHTCMRDTTANSLAISSRLSFPSEKAGAERHVMIRTWLWA